MSPGALDGIKIFEFASYVSGPYAGMLLSDLGAEVVKVETPDGGDPFRMWGKTDYNGTFGSMNRNKKSVTLDLKTEAGRAAARKLTLGADVVIENMRAGAMERFGLGYEALAADNPRLVYCSITGFGSQGPYRERPGYDTVGQAVSGLLSVLTDRKAPQPMGVSLSDHLAGAFAAYGVLAALMARATTGRGQKVETSLLQATLSFLGENAATFFEDGNVPSRQSRCRRAQVFTFTAGDGLPFVVHLSSPEKFWRGMLIAIESRGPGRRRSIPNPGTASQELRCAVRRTRRNIPVTAPRRMACAPWRAGCAERPAQYPRRGLRRSAGRRARYAQELAASQPRHGLRRRQPGAAQCDTAAGRNRRAGSGRAQRRCFCAEMTYGSRESSETGTADFNKNGVARSGADRNKREEAA